jgi:hypothetical protein
LGAERDNAIQAARGAYLQTFGYELYMQAIGERPLTPKVPETIKYDVPDQPDQDH